MIIRRPLINAKAIVDQYSDYDTDRAVNIDEILCNSKSIDLSVDSQFKYYGTGKESVNIGYMINYESAISLCEIIGGGYIKNAISYLNYHGLYPGRLTAKEYKEAKGKAKKR